VRFRVIAVYEQSVDELLAMPGRLWTVFTPAARDASVESVSRAVRAAEKRARTKTELEDLLATMELVAESQGALDAIQEMLMKAMDDKGITHTSKIIRRWREDGWKEGLGAVVRMIERKVGRPLTAEEREVLYARAGTGGVERLGDVVLDLDGPALAAWLASTAA
jgi:hypothetical protein